MGKELRVGHEGVDRGNEKPVVRVCLCPLGGAVLSKHKPDLGLKPSYERCDKEVLGVVNVENRPWARNLEEPPKERTLAFDAEDGHVRFSGIFKDKPGSVGHKGRMDFGGELGFGQHHGKKLHPSLGYRTKNVEHV
jgi:hypothetical protein